MTITSRLLCRLSNVALASALVGLLAACGGGGDGVERESPLAAGGPCKARNESTGVQYMKTADPVGEAIAAATAGDTIRIWGVCYGHFVVSKSLTLQGQGAKATLDGGGGSISPVVTVPSGVSANINDLTIAHGDWRDGGGIYNRGTLTLTHSIVSENRAVDLDVNVGNGGGILNGGTLSLVDSNVRGNHSPSGGGIANYGPLTLTNSSVSGNTATWGGGVNNGLSGTLTLTDSTVSGNTATLYGGGAYNWGAMALANSTVIGNTAQDGGGIYSTGTLSFTDTTFSGNDPNDIAP